MGTLPCDAFAAERFEDGGFDVSTENLRPLNVPRVHPRGRFHLPRALTFRPREARGAEALGHERATSGVTRS
jgi:hypothetical protein